MATPSPGALSCCRWLSAVSLLWGAVLVLVPGMHGSRLAFYLSCALLVVNAMASLAQITALRKIPLLLNCVQLALFGLLNHQFACAFGAGHYHFDRPPRWFDWVEFHFAHLLRATDLLDAIDEYGIPIQTITHDSPAAGVLIVCMHVTADVFLLGLILHWLQGFRSRSRRTVLQQQRRVFAFFLLSLLCVLLCFVLAKVEGWSPADRFLWPLDNLLRLLDFGDSMQVFHWQLHTVAPTDFNQALALFFRFTAGVWMGALVLYVRLGILRGWGYSADQLVEHLQDGDALVRRSAATNLGACSRDAARVVPALVGALEDYDREVRRCAVESLGQVGAVACPAVPMILDEMIRTSSAPFHLAAAVALGRIGPRDQDRADVAYCLGLLQMCYPADSPTHRAICEAQPWLGSPRKQAQARLSAAHRGHQDTGWGGNEQSGDDRTPERVACGASIRDRLERLCEQGFLRSERTVAEIGEELAAERGQHLAQSSLYAPLVALVAAGTLTRRKQGQRWLYLATPRG